MTTSGQSLIFGSQCWTVGAAPLKFDQFSKIPLLRARDLLKRINFTALTSGQNACVPLPHLSHCGLSIVDIGACLAGKAHCGLSTVDIRPHLARQTYCGLSSICVAPRLATQAHRGLAGIRIRARLALLTGRGGGGITVIPNGTLGAGRRGPVGVQSHTAVGTH